MQKKREETEKRNIKYKEELRLAELRAVEREKLNTTPNYLPFPEWVPHTGPYTEQNPQGRYFTEPNQFHCNYKCCYDKGPWECR